MIGEQRKAKRKIAVFAVTALLCLMMAPKVYAYWTQQLTLQGNVVVERMLESSDELTPTE